MNRKMPIRAYLLLSLAGLYIIASAFAVLYISEHMKKHALEEAKEKSLIILERNLATHTYFAHDLKPAVFDMSDPCMQGDYFDPAWMSSTFAVRRIDEYFRDLSHEDYYYKECAINARSPLNEADDYERAFIARLNNETELVDSAEIRIIDGKPYWAVLRRGEVMEEPCLRCHSTASAAPSGLVDKYGPDRSFGRHVGEVVSAISIHIPLSAAYENAEKLTRLLSAGLLVVLLAVFVLMYSMSRKLIFSPLDRLREHTSRISRDESLLGESLPLPVGRELAELTEAFNAMSEKLRRDRDNLEEIVSIRTMDLKETNELLIEDIDEIKRSRDALKQAEVKRAELYAMLSHDMKSPLLVMDGNAQLLLQKYSGSLDDDAVGMLESIRRNCDKQVRMMDDFVAIARLEDGALRVEKKPVDIPALMKAINIRFQPLARIKGLALDAEQDGAVPEILADVRYLERALANLVQNAISYTESGSVTIRTSPAEGRPGYVTISVTDTGPGMEASESEKAFDKYYRSPSRKDTLGSGLGLAIVKAVAEAHGGGVGLDTAPGKGSTFSITLPVGDDETDTAAR